MSLKKIKYKDKKRIFEMLAALAIIAGQDMSDEGYDIFNDTLLSYLNRYGLLEDFNRSTSEYGMGMHPSLRDSGFC